MRANSRDMTLGDDFAETPGPDGLRALRWYGLTDTGLYHLGRWRAWGMRFGPTEREHCQALPRRGARGGVPPVAYGRADTLAGGDA